MCAPIAIPGGSRWARRLLLAAVAAVLVLAGLLLAGCSGPDFREGLDAYQSGEYEQAAEIWGGLAREGDRLAQHHLANLYRVGLGVERSPDQALRWARKAANAGQPEAYAHVAFLYQSGLAGPQSPRKAYQWYYLAAETLPPGAKRREAARNRERIAERLDAEELRAAERWLEARTEG